MRTEFHMFFTKHSVLIAAFSILTTMAQPNTTTTTLPPFTLSSPPGTDIWRKPPSTQIKPLTPSPSHI